MRLLTIESVIGPKNAKIPEESRLFYWPSSGFLAFFGDQ
jgi:hypothetical protein